MEFKNWRDAQFFAVVDFITNVARVLKPVDVHVGSITLACGSTSTTVPIVFIVVPDEIIDQICQSTDAQMINRFNFNINCGTRLCEHGKKEIWGYVVRHTTFRRVIWPRPQKGGWWENDKLELEFALRVD